MTLIYNLTRKNLSQLLKGKWQLPASHADQVFKNLYREDLEKPLGTAGLPKKLAALCEGVLDLKHQLAIDRAAESGYDGSVKFLIRLADDLLVETVLMPETNRLTICVSSQVGCAQGCVFCHTGRMGLLRNLSTAEICGQVVLVNRWLREHPGWLSRQGLAGRSRVDNLVFMGMGEPLDNVENLGPAIDILCDPMGLAIAPRRISVSTAGHLDGLRRLHRTHPKVPIALSLHASADAERSKLLPINRRFPVAEVLDYLRRFYADSKQTVLIQYTVIAGVNDSVSDAQKMAALLDGLKVKINLIPLNTVTRLRLRAPEAESLQLFRDTLHQLGFRVMVRFSKGQDISAACGQLVSG